MQPENTTPDSVVNTTPGLASQLQSPVKRRYTGLVIVVLVAFVFGIAAYGYILTKKNIVAEPVISNQVQETPQEEDPEVKKEKEQQAILDKIAQEDGEVKPLSAEEQQAILDKIESEDTEDKPLTAEEKQVILDNVQFQDADLTNSQQ